MKVTFLGTAAAEGIPALWCECATCKKARAVGGKELRRRSSYLVDGDTMIDFGPDVYWQMIEFGIDWAALKRVVITHNHGDHLSPMEFLWRRAPWFSQFDRELAVIGSRRVLSRILAFVAEDTAVYKFEDLQIRPVELAHGESTDEGDIKITALEADHAPGHEAQIFLLERGGKRFLVANDTGLLPDSSWEKLKGIKLDLVTIDTTMGIAYADQLRGHLGVNGVLKFRDKLAELGCVTGATQVYANHFSHNGGNLHGDLETFFEPHGIKVAYDGLCIEL